MDTLVTLELPQNYFGIILVLHWNHFYDYIGITFGLHWNYSRITLGLHLLYKEALFSSPVPCCGYRCLLALVSFIVLSEFKKKTRLLPWYLANYFENCASV